MGAVVALPVPCMMAGFHPALSGFRATGAREGTAGGRRQLHMPRGNAPLNHLGGGGKPGQLS